MITLYVKYVLSIFTIATLITSFLSQKYYRKVLNNTYEFDFVISKIYDQRLFVKNDSLLLKNGKSILVDGDICIYYENLNDSLVKNFMKKYELKKICYTRIGTEYFDSVVTFHKDYTPFMEKAIIISYDFGKSGLRERAKNGNKLKDENVKIMNDLYLYRLRLKPAFGE